MLSNMTNNTRNKFCISKLVENYILSFFTKCLDASVLGSCVPEITHQYVINALQYVINTLQYVITQITALTPPRDHRFAPHVILSF